MGGTSIANNVLSRLWHQDNDGDVDVVSVSDKGQLLMWSENNGGAASASLFPYVGASVTAMPVIVSV